MPELDYSPKPDPAETNVKTLSTTSIESDKSPIDPDDLFAAIRPAIERELGECVTVEQITINEREVRVTTTSL